MPTILEQVTNDDIDDAEAITIDSPTGLKPRTWAKIKALLGALFAPVAPTDGNFRFKGNGNTRVLQLFDPDTGLYHDATAWTNNGTEPATIRLAAVGEE